MDERMPLRAAFQITSWEKKQGIQAGWREGGGRQTGRVSPEAGRGEENGRIPRSRGKKTV